MTIPRLNMNCYVHSGNGLTISAHLPKVQVRCKHNSASSLKNSTRMLFYRPALEHRLAETWAANLRVMLPVGHARTDRLTGQREKGKFCSLTADDLSRRVGTGWYKSNKANAQGKMRIARTRQHSGNRPFLFLSHFRADNSHMKRPGLAHFCLGGLVLFSALSFSFTVGFNVMGSPEGERLQHQLRSSLNPPVHNTD